MNKDETWLLKEKYGGMESEAFHADLKRLQSGEPLGYVIGHVPFLNCKIYLDSHPLIPRAETEFWVEKAILSVSKAKKVKDGLVAKGNPRQNLPRVTLGKNNIDLQNDYELMVNDSPIQILDLCAGSGAIGVAIAKAVPEAHVTLAEIDKAHLPTIGKNLEANDILCTRYQVFQSDLFENISGPFDFILSNPPYIDPKVDRTEPSVKEHEPHLALYGGENGMELVTRIIAEARASLAPHGQLWLEHEPEQVDAIALLAKTHNFSVSTHPDQYNLLRYSILVVQ